MKTAVEWQFEQFFNSFEKFNNREYTFVEYLKRNLEIYEQAKEMEKQQQEKKLYSDEEVWELLKNVWKATGNLKSTEHRLIEPFNKFKKK
jgi:hypothetical protein